MWIAVITYRTHSGTDYHRYRIESLSDLSDLIANGANRHAIEAVQLTPEFSDISIYADNDESVLPCWESPAPFALSRPEPQAHSPRTPELELRDLLEKAG